MNDRFKFRMYDTNVNKMYMPNDFEEVESIYECIKQQINWDLDVDYDIKFNHLEDGRFFMQCTGLKDKNGKLIYEGDILKRPLSYPKNSYFYEVVIWERKRWQLARPQECNCQFPQKQCKHCEKIPERKNWFFQNNDTSFKNFYESEVIGNIYENKELLDERN